MSYKILILGSREWPLSVPSTFCGKAPLNASRALFCPTCGQIWTRWINPRRTEWHIVDTASCAEHADIARPWQVAGSIYTMLEMSDPHTALPATLLVREVALHVAHFQLHAKE